MSPDRPTGPGSASGQRPQTLPAGARVVLKVGSSSLTRPDGGLDLNRIDILAGLIAGLRRRGHDVILVTSGAVAAGLTPLGLEARPQELRLLQAAASVGQGNLMARWQTAMSAYGVVAAQVLLTAQDVAVRSHYRTVRATFDALLSRTGDHCSCLSCQSGFHDVSEPAPSSGRGSPTARPPAGRPATPTRPTGPGSHPRW